MFLFYLFSFPATSTVLHTEEVLNNTKDMNEQITGYIYREETCLYLSLPHFWHDSLPVTLKLYRHWDGAFQKHYPQGASSEVY